MVIAMTKDWCAADRGRRDRFGREPYPHAEGRGRARFLARCRPTRSRVPADRDALTAKGSDGGARASDA
jgi:hypothetical protein